MKNAITGEGLLEAAGRRLAELIGDGMERLFGLGVRAKVVGDITWVDLGAVLSP